MPEPVTAIKTIATVGSAAMAKRSASKAAKAMAADRDYQRRMYEAELSRQEPFRQAATRATQQLEQLYGPGGAYATGPTREQLLADPLYGAGLDESIKALERSAAARGGLLSGRTIRGVRSETLQGLQNAFMRNMGQREAQTNVLAGLAGRTGANVNIPTGDGGGEAMANYEMQKNALAQSLLDRALKAYGGRRAGGLQDVTVTGSRYQTLPGGGYRRIPGGP